MTPEAAAAAAVLEWLAAWNGSVSIHERTRDPLRRAEAERRMLDSGRSAARLLDRLPEQAIEIEGTRYAGSLSESGGYMIRLMPKGGE